jgi:hypothetical protein
MDSKQPWYGIFFELDQVYRALKELEAEDYRSTKHHELFITWVVARFLQSQAKSEHAMGFPSLGDCRGMKLSNLLKGKEVVDNDNFDTVIIDKAKPLTPIRLQIKRYSHREAPSTEDFFEYMCEKTDRYGDAPEINLVFHLEHNLAFDFPKFGRLVRSREFKVGSITVFATVPGEPRCFLFAVHPNFTGQLWGPSSDER